MKKRLFLAVSFIFVVFTLVGCAASVQTMKTKVGNYTLKFTGDEARNVELKDDGTGFYVTDSDDETVVDATYVYPDKISVSSDYETKTVNEKEYLVFSLEDGNTYYCTYLADIGADIGLMLTIPEGNDSEISYITLGGKSLDGASSDPSKYFTNLMDVEPEIEVDDEDADALEGNLYFSSGVSFHTDLDFNSADSGRDDITFWVTEDESSGLYLYTVEDSEEYVDTVTDKLKESSGETPFVIVNQEGTYINGFANGQFELIFVTEGKDGAFYVLDMITVDKNCSKIMYQLVDEFLASGIAKAETRIKYEEENYEDDIDDADGTEETENVSSSYDGYEVTYECEFFTNYDNDAYEVTVYNEMQDEYAEARDEGESSLLNDVYDSVSISNLDVAGEKLCIIEATSSSFYSYAAVSEDDSICIEFSSSLGEKMSQSEMEEVLSTFVK